jgi:hypothetical protein
MGFWPRQPFPIASRSASPRGIAEACGKAGQAAEGLRLLAEALAAAHKTGERFYAAELHG